MRSQLLMCKTVMVVMAVAVMLSAAAWADCGSIPFFSPIRARDSISVVSEGLLAKPEVRLDPLEVVVYEPGQRAIILWNGREEILLLSTELRTAQAISVLEVVPLSAEPVVTLGEFETFEKMQDLVVRKTLWSVASGGGVADVKAPKNAARITFHERMGAHDVAVVQVLDKRHFVQWVTTYLVGLGAENPQVRPDFAQIIQNYVDRGFEWFSFDVIETGDTVKSRQPIQYRFESPALYYPLEISTLEKGKTNINLLLVSPRPLGAFPEIRKASLKRHEQFAATPDEIRPISEEWAAFMNGVPFVLQQVRIRGKLEHMTTDLLVR